MAARGKRGLDPAQLDTLRAQLDAGKRPRVQLSDPQFGGNPGTIVRIGSPERDGADYLVVRVRLNGVTDELSFAPSELTIGGPKRGSTKPAARARPAARRSPAPARAPVVKDTAALAAAPAKASAGPAVPAAPALSPLAPATVAASAGGSRTTATATPTTVGPAVAASPRRAGGRKKAAPAAKVTVTLTSAGSSWSVSASRGTKPLAKAVDVAPGVVTAIVRLLDQAAITGAVDQINEQARAEAEARANELRAELAALEDVLQAHRPPT